MSTALIILTVILLIALLATWEGSDENENKSMPLALAYSVTAILMVCFEIWSRTH